MAEEHRESDPPKKKNDPIRREEKRHAERVGEASSGTSEGRSGSSFPVTRSGENKATATTSVPQTSELASGTVGTGAVPKTSSKKKGLFSKWKSPKKKKTGGSKSSRKVEKESPDKQHKVSMGTFKGIVKTVKKIFVGSTPTKSEKMPLAEPETASRHHGEGTSYQRSTETNPESSWKPKHQDKTGQECVNLGGVLTTSDETVFFVDTEMTSVSGSVSVGAENASLFQSLPMDSCEGSTGDASSLEKEFKELPSPSKSGQGRKRTQNPQQEEECAMESGVSPRKRQTLHDTDRKEKSGDSDTE